MRKLLSIPAALTAVLLASPTALASTQIYVDTSDPAHVKVSTTESSSASSASEKDSDSAEETRPTPVSAEPSTNEIVPDAWTAMNNAFSEELEKADPDTAMSDIVQAAIDDIKASIKEEVNNSDEHRYVKLYFNEEDNTVYLTYYDYTCELVGSPEWNPDNPEPDPGTEEYPTPPDPDVNPTPTPSPNPTPVLPVDPNPDAPTTERQEETPTIPSTGNGTDDSIIKVEESPTVTPVPTTPIRVASAASVASADTTTTSDDSSYLYEDENGMYYVCYMSDKMSIPIYTLPDFPDAPEPPTETPDRDRDDDPEFYPAVIPVPDPETSEPTYRYVWVQRKPAPSTGR
jgi:hypothetical protein